MAKKSEATLQEIVEKLEDDVVYDKAEKKHDDARESYKGLKKRKISNFQEFREKIIVRHRTK